MNTSGGERNPVGLLAEDFLDRRRRGERPALRESVDQHPELAEEIRDHFPALLMMEDLGESSGGSTGPLAADGRGPPGRCRKARRVRRTGRAVRKELRTNVQGQCVNSLRRSRLDSEQ
jgi:hypothetical protein